MCNNDFVILISAHVGDIRLFDGTVYGWGRVEIFYNDQWGTICDDGWSSYDASVTCRYRCRINPLVYDIIRTVTEIMRHV